MKKLLLLIIISFISITTFAQFNVYRPFPDSNAWWRVSTGADNGSGTWLTSEYDYYINGDTSITGQKYHKIYKSGGTINNVTSQFIKYVGAIREDSMRHIYMYTLPPGASEALLYDFNMKVGDTLPSLLINDPYSIISPNGPNYVYGIDSILIGANYRKQFLIACDTGAKAKPFDSIIEGIGSSMGLLEEIEKLPESSASLDCFRQNSITIYPHFGDSCQLYYVGINEVVLNREVITAFPNPANTGVTISYQLQSGQANGMLRLYNSMGQLQRIENINRNTGTINENISTLPGGVYYYTLSVDGIVQATNKLVIIR